MPSHRRTSRWPRMFDASTPVTSSSTNTTRMPRPGMRRPKRSAGRTPTGSSWSIDDDQRVSTQTVMTSGIQISRPVMRYFFKGRLLQASRRTRPAPARRAPPEPRVARASVRAGSRRGRDRYRPGRRFRVGSWRRSRPLPYGPRFRTGPWRPRQVLWRRHQSAWRPRQTLSHPRPAHPSLPQRLRSTAVAEVGRVPPRPLELEARSCELFDELSSLHAGQVVMRGSLTFCRNSFSNPHAVQR